jgi:uncharacterized membrane protein
MRGMKAAQAHLLRLFVTGLLAVLPLAATVAVFAWAFQLLFGWMGPGSGVGSVLMALGLGGFGSTLLAYLIGIGLLGALVVGLGLLVELGFQRGLARFVNRVVRRIPLVGQVYDVASKLVSLFAQRGSESSARAMRPVWCHFGGGPDGAAVLGLQSSPDVVLVSGRRCLVVLVPTAPVPVGGGLLFVPEAWVQPADLSVEAVTSLYLSMGVTAGQHLAVAPVAAGQPATLEVPPEPAVLPPVSADRTGSS